jgi:hypothetical protein
MEISFTITKHNIMKKIISLLVILVTFYFIVADGMMTVFNLSRGIQYAFNFGAIFMLLPFSLFYLVGLDKEEAR